ncbi:site-2 protease family protein [Candidatus Saganbacteria bacterium]|uniref:Site-2 protease family protein n=1 Tax=Candidatus Saganbacteria bacterium TaxID=2575572 RepID=A0A9D6YVD9_UNCSA|nr:site-2 protease family protein [Candidatus Saganbacteria bacterium]
MFDLSFLIISLPVLLVTITLHEAAHAKAADMLGDPTPRLAGRLTLNPVAHIDPIGLAMLILVRFGWAKPVPINPYNFSDPRKGSLIVSLAGPLSNFLFAWFLAIIFRTLPISPGGVLSSIISYTIWINLALAVFNLIPIPPLDGSHILEFFLPPHRMEIMYRLQQYSLIILISILMFGSPLLFAVIEFLYGLLV